MSASTVVVDTKRLRLREANPADVEFVIELLNDPQWLQNIGDRQVRDEVSALAYIENSLQGSYSQYGFGMYVVESLADGQPVGMCGLVKREGLDDVDIGFAFLPAYRGSGLALESAAGIIEYAQDTLKLERLVAITLPANEASWQLLEKLGFTFTQLIHLQGDSEKLRLYLLNLGETA